MKRVREEELLELFQQTGVLLEGHFLLTSGHHSPRFLQCAQIMQYPEHATRLAAQLIEPFQDRDVEAVMGPALGGIILAYEVARQLGVRALFAEKQGEQMTLRRGFQLTSGERVLVVEDAVSTGTSVRRVMKAVREKGAEVVGVGMLVDRSAGRIDFGVPQHSLLELAIPFYNPADCPLCRQGIPLIIPKNL